MSSRRRCGASSNARRNPRSAPDSHRPGASAWGTSSGWAGASVASSGVGRTACRSGADADSDSASAVEVKGGAGAGGSAVGASGAICVGGEAGTGCWAGEGSRIDASSATAFGAKVSGGLSRAERAPPNSHLISLRNRAHRGFAFMIAARPTDGNAGSSASSPTFPSGGREIGTCTVRVGASRDYPV